MTAIAFRRAPRPNVLATILAKFPNAWRISCSAASAEVLLELSRRSNLRTLSAAGSDVVDVSALAECASLHTLDLSRCTSLEDVSALVGCANLHTLILTGCSVVDIAPLAGCAEMQALDLRDCRGVVDVTALAMCKAL